MSRKYKAAVRALAIDFVILLVLVSPIVIIAWIKHPENLLRSWPYFLPMFAFVGIIDLARIIFKRR